MTEDEALFQHWDNLDKKKKLRKRGLKEDGWVAQSAVREMKTVKQILSMLVLAIMLMPIFVAAVPISTPVTDNVPENWWEETTVDRDGDGIGDMVEKYMYHPQVIDDENTNQPNDKFTPLYKDSKNIRIVQDAMFGSTNEVMGTSYRSRINDPKYQFAGKTGTAQVKKITERDRELDLKTFEIPYEERDHALYIAFGPYKSPRYALSILVEHGGNGSTTAAPMAKKLFKLIIDRHSLRDSINNKKYLDI